MYFLLGGNLIKTNQLVAAEVVFRELLRRNPEQHSSYHQLEIAVGAKTVEQKLALYAEFRDKYPRAQTPERLPLDFTDAGSVFTGLLDPYMRKALRKGIPPLFVDLRPLYSDPKKVSKSC
jgi:hypothetical protein